MGCLSVQLRRTGSRRIGAEYCEKGSRGLGFKGEGEGRGVRKRSGGGAEVGGAIGDAALESNGGEGAGGNG